MLLFVVILLAGALTLWFLPLRLQVTYHQHTTTINAHLRLYAPLVKLERHIPVSEKIAGALEQWLKRWRKTGAPVKAPKQKMPNVNLGAVVGRPLRYLMRRMRCTRLDARVVVGGRDAMESALLAGAVWAVIGVAVAFLGNRVQLDPQVPRVQVSPNFRQPTWQVRTDCILRFRLGHAIVAGVWLMRRALREKELVAWVRDSRRRKGVEGSGSSNPGADEDGHGEP